MRNVAQRIEQMTESRARTSVAIVGPVPPFKGGIAQHTEHLADALVDHGLPVAVETWASQYPSFLYPGEQYIPRPDVVAPRRFEVTTKLRWFDPVGWVRCGLRNRHCSHVAFTLVVPVQVVPFIFIRIFSSLGGRRPRFLVIAHNVLPHEPRPGDRFLVRSLLRLVDRLIVHSEAQSEVASSLSSVDVSVEALPPHLPTTHRSDRRDQARTNRLLFFGLIRPYKGLDDLLDALVDVPTVDLLVCGELWGDPAELTGAIDERGLGGRVEVRPHYVADDDVPAVFEMCDALVLPYRSGTGSQNVLLGHQLGVPVIATDVAGFGDQIVDGETGLVCSPEDPAALAAAITSLYEGENLESMRASVAAAVTPSTSWETYVATLLSL